MVPFIPLFIREVHDWEIESMAHLLGTFML